MPIRFPRFFNVVMFAGLMMFASFSGFAADVEAETGQVIKLGSWQGNKEVQVGFGKGDGSTPVFDAANADFLSNADWFGARIFLKPYRESWVTYAFETDGPGIKKLRLNIDQLITSKGALKVLIGTDNQNWEPVVDIPANGTIDNQEAEYSFEQPARTVYIKFYRGTRWAGDDDVLWELKEGIYKRAGSPSGAPDNDDVTPWIFSTN